jgi:hypothetical protein
VRKNNWLQGWPSALLTVLVVMIVGISSGRLRLGDLEHIAKLWFEQPLGPHWAYIALWTVTMYVAMLSAKRVYELGRSRLLVLAIAILAAYAAITALASGAIGKPTLTPSSLVANITLWVFLVTVARPKPNIPLPDYKRAGESVFPERNKPPNPRNTWGD